MLYREIEEKIKDFFQTEKKSALMITGARQVGKTYCIREFAKENFPYVIEINFLEMPSAVTLFENASDSRDILLRISALTDVPMEKGKTLIFFDEVQEAARAGDAELNDLLSACCRAVRVDESRAGFMAPADFAPVLLGLICHIWERGEFENLATDEALAAAGRALRGELERAGSALRTLIGVEDLECNKNFITFLDKLAAWCKNEVEFILPESVYTERGELAECLNKKSALPSEQAETAFSLWQFAYRRAAADMARIYEARRILPYARLAARLAGAFKVWLAEKGLIPSGLLDGYAHDILSRELGPSEAYCRFGARLEHLLVDEFQDTSRAQWRAIEPLAEECLAGGGSVIYVGDVKQAIYGWRGGDAALFKEIAENPVLARIAGGAKVTALPANWRSLGRIVDLNNTVFAALKDRETALNAARAILGRECPTGIVADTARDFTETFGSAAQELPLQREADRERGYVRLERLGGGAAVSEDDSETLIYYGAGEADPPLEGDAAADLSGYADLGDRAREVYRRMRAMLMDDILLRRPPGEVAILTRGNADARTVARWLSAWGVPTITENSLLLSEHPLIAQIIAFLRFMDNPLDDPALFEFLCSEDIFAAVAGLDVAALHDWLLRLPEKREPLFAVFRRDFPEVWAAWIAPFYQQAGLMSAYDLTCELLRHFGVWARRTEDAVFLRRFLELLHGAEERDMQSLPEFLEWWSGAGNIEKLPVAESLNAVRIMTMHKAKGLEFPVVIAPFNDFLVKASNDFQRAALAGGEVLLKERKAFGETYFRDLARQAREAMHLAYVAWTRAAEELYALLPPEETGDTAERPRRGAPGVPVSRGLDILLAGLSFDEDGIYESGEPKSARAACSSDFVPEDDSLPPDWADDQQIRLTPQLGFRREGVPGDGDLKETFIEYSPPSLHLHSAQDERPFEVPSPGAPVLMSWLPRLKIYRNVHESQGGAARERGVLIHNCLEHLRFAGSGAAEIRQAALRAFMHARRVLNLPRLEEELYREIMDLLIWVLSLPEAVEWFGEGRPEQEILTAEGARKVADRLAITPRGAVILEYKTGAADLPPAALPLPEHVAQLRSYLTLVAKIRREPAEGRLVYLDRREIYPVKLAGANS